MTGGASRWRVCYQQGLPRLVFSIVGASSWVSSAKYFVTVGPSGFSRPLFCDGRSYQVSPEITFVTVRAVGPGCVSPAEPVLGGLDRTEHKPGVHNLVCTF